MVLKEVNCKINRLSHALIHASKNMRQFVYDHVCTWKHRLIFDYAIIAIIISKVDDAKTLCTYYDKKTYVIQGAQIFRTL